MSLEIIKNKIQQEIEELFASAVVDELAGDEDLYFKKAATIAQIAELLGIKTEIKTTTFRLT